MIVVHTVVIDRPLDEVWAAWDDPELQVEWQTKLREYEHVSGKPQTKGAVSRLTFDRDNGETILISTVLARKPGKSFSAEYKGMQLPFILTSTFSAIDDETTEFRAEIEVKLNLLQKALGLVLKPAMENLAEENGRDFKKYVESR